MLGEPKLVLKMETCELPGNRLFHDVVRERYSARTYLPTPVPEKVIRAVLEDAQHAPSNNNIQPWEVHIVSGATRNELSKALLKAEAEGRQSSDFPYDYSFLYGAYQQRASAQVGAYYKSLGVPREAIADIRKAVLRNLEFFGAPHAALLFMPELGDCVRVAGDIGMYGQTFLLSLAAHGLAGCPQTLLGFYADTVRDVLGIDSSMKMLFGISFGYADVSSVGSRYRIDRVPIEDSVTFHS